MIFREGMAQDDDRKIKFILITVEPRYKEEPRD